MSLSAEAVNYPIFKAGFLQYGMLRHEKLQLAGPLSLALAISCAQIAAHGLAIWPTSPFIWYLNLELFQPFRYCLEGLSVTFWHGETSGLAQSIWLLILLVGLIFVAEIGRLRLPLAIASNLSLIYSAALLCWPFLATEILPQHRLSLTAFESP